MPHPTMPPAAALHHQQTKETSHAVNYELNLKLWVNFSGMWFSAYSLWRNSVVSYVSRGSGVFFSCVLKRGVTVVGLGEGGKCWRQDDMVLLCLRKLTEKVVSSVCRRRQLRNWQPRKDWHVQGETPIMMSTARLWATADSGLSDCYLIRTCHTASWKREKRWK